jgi:predicted anti-sigma-YlaC factor YlaD
MFSSGNPPPSSSNPSTNPRFKSILASPGFDAWRRDPIFQSTWAERLLVTPKHLATYAVGVVVVGTLYWSWTRSGWGFTHSTPPVASHAHGSHKTEETATHH